MNILHKIIFHFHLYSLIEIYNDFILYFQSQHIHSKILLKHSENLNNLSNSHVDKSKLNLTILKIHQIFQGYKKTHELIHPWKEF